MDEPIQFKCTERFVSGGFSLSKPSQPLDNIINIHQWKIKKIPAKQLIQQISSENAITDRVTALVELERRGLDEKTILLLSRAFKNARA